MMHNPEVRDALTDPLKQQLSRGMVAPLPGTTEDTLGYQLGRGIGQQGLRHQFLSPVSRYVSWLARNPGRGSVTGALAGAAGGWLFSKLRGDDSRGPVLGGAALGGLGSYLLSRSGQRAGLAGPLGQPGQPGQPGQQKRAFYTSNDADATTYIQSRIVNDYRLSHPQRAYLESTLGQLSPSQRTGLMDVLRSAGGAGAGALVARYLLNLGFGGTILMALAGAAAGNLFGGPPRDIFGSAQNNQTDAFGNMRLLQ